MRRLLSRLGRDDRGAALVEFAILLPMMLLLFAVTIEGGRLFWSYQATIAGVRDASRYLARVAPSDLCASGGSLAGYTAQLETIVRTRASGAAVFPTGISVTSVTPTFTCGASTFRNGAPAIASVRADLQVTFPFAGVFGLFGQELNTIDTFVVDQNRVYGT